MYSKVRDLDFSILHPTRAGIVPVIADFYCFGIDRVHNEITDFGGGISYKKDLTPLRAACREFYEESLGVFKKPLTIFLQDDTAIYDDKTLIIFHKIKDSTVDDIDKYSNLFNERRKQEKYPEVSDIIWLTRKEIQKLIYTEKALRPSRLDIYGASETREFFMYDKVKNLLRKSKFFL